MLTTADCKYIVSEVRNIPYYDAKVRWCDERLKELEDDLTRSTGPFSPNGGTDVLVGNKVVRVRTGGHGESAEQKILRISEQKDSVEQLRSDFRKRRAKAGWYYKQMLRDSEWHGFVTEFFNNRQYDSLSIKFNIGNPYRQIINIARNNVRGL